MCVLCENAQVYVFVCVCQSDLVPRQVDVSAFSSATADKLAVRLWEVRPEGTALVPVDAKVQDANNRQTQIRVSESKKKPAHKLRWIVKMAEDEKVTLGRLGTGTGHLDRDERPNLQSTP